MADSRPSTAQHLERTKAIGRWLQVVAPDDKRLQDAAADLADIIYAAADVSELVNDLIKADCSTEDGRWRAAQLATDVLVQLESEIKPHLDSVLPPWRKLLERLDQSPG